MGLMNDTPTFVSLAAFARLCGVSGPCVTGWKRRGHIVLVDGKVDVAESNRRLAARPTARHGGLAKVKPAVEEPEAAADPANWTRGEALRQLEISRARLAQIEADRMAGLVVPKADVVAVVRNEYTIVRTAMLGLASKLAHRLAAATTPEACGALVDGEVREILGALTADGGAK
jgi:hypothetical protein